MNRIGMILGISLFLTSAAFAQTPTISAGGIFNVASYARQGLPNAAIAQGSMFAVFGSNLGPASGQSATSFPLPISLGGTSIRVTVSGTSTDAIILYTSSGQVNAVLRSNTPTGTGTLSVTRNGVASAPASITVVRSSFGVFAANSQGNGAGVITHANYQFVTALNPASPGETLLIWGTGLGPVSGDETSNPSVGDLSVAVEVLVGSSAATVSYRGRNPCCSGLDQINFVVPQGLSGCTIPVAVKINNIVSNFTTIAVSNSGPCSDPTGLSSENLQRLQSQGNLRIGSVFLSRTSTSTGISIPGVPETSIFEGASGNFTRVDQAQLLQSQGSLSQVSIGACAVSSFSGQAASNPSFSLFTGLDAGANLSLNGPGGARQLPRLPTTPGVNTGTYSGSYFLTLRNVGEPAYVSPGTYTFSGPGGADVGPFSASVNVSSTVNWTNSSVTTINRSQGFTVTWTGGPSSGFIVIGGTSFVLNSDNSSFGATFYCLAQAGPGQFTIPSAVLLALPASSTIGQAPFTFSTGSLFVGSYIVSTFTASGLDQGYVGYTDTFGKSLAYQ